VQLALRDELAFVTATMTFRGVSIAIPDVLVDTGAASTVLNADIAAEANVFLEHNDRLRMLRGVGGREFVFVRRIARLAVGSHGLDDFEVEIGEMDYGFEIGGILGMDFLRAAGATIDLRAFTIEFAQA
jgi:predicted aspartyl protease